MPISLNLRLCATCDGLQVWDQTRPYDAIDNPGGYGDPNPDFGELTPYTVDIYAPGATTPTFTLDLLSSSPSPDSDGDYHWDISVEDLQGGNAYSYDHVRSGWWKATFTAGDDGNVNGGTPIVVRIDCFFTGHLETLIVNDTCAEQCGVCECHTDRWLQLMGAQNLFKDCGNPTKAQEVVTSLYRQVAKACGCT